MGMGPLTDAEADELQKLQEDAQTECKRVFQQSAPDAARKIVHIALFGSNERIQLQACMHVLERVLGRVQDQPQKPVDDPYTELFDGLKEMLATSQPSTAVTATPNQPVGFSPEPERIEPGTLHTGLMRDIYREDDNA